MNEVAVVKPDHLGDMVLSIPAIRALIARFRSISLFAAPANRFLAQHFLPEADYEPIALRYLQKTGGGVPADELVRRLRGHSVVIFLREDGVMQDVAARSQALAYIERGSFERHETLTQRDNVSRIIGPYSRAAMMPGAPRNWPTALRTVGLCVSAGFHANKWPTMLWVALGKLLVGNGGVRLRVIGGPAEREELELLRRRFGLDPNDIVVGTRDVDCFLERVVECDAVIGTDSGTLHLVSTRVPVLGLFTSSPWRRFAPFGIAHRIMTAEVACSPCVQFMSTHYNACLTRECAMLIEPRTVVEVLQAGLDDHVVTTIAGLTVASDPARCFEDAGQASRLHEAGRHPPLVAVA